MNESYLKGVEHGKKFIEYANKYGLLDPKTHYWSIAGSCDKVYFYRGFFIALK